MKKIREYLKEDLNIELPETDTINGEWFEENNLPMIVECASCGMSMSILSNSIRVDEDGTILCVSCVE